MINSFYTKFAKLVVHYSIEIRKGDRVLIEGPTFAKELIQALYLETLKAGGHPLVMPELEDLKELLLKNASEEQLLFLHNTIKSSNIESMILSYLHQYLNYESANQTRERG